MGSYCKYCNTRCFKYTTKNSLIKTDLEATCENGIIHDMDATYPRLINTKNVHIGWLLELKRGEDFSLFAELSNGKVMEYEIKNTEFEEILKLTDKVDRFYRLTK